MRPDLLSKRLFLSGCLGLPWLWVVHVLYSRELERKESTEPSRNSLISEQFPDEATNMTEEQILETRNFWVQKCKSAAFVVLAGWAVWIVLAQVLKNSLPGTWYVRAPDDNEWTGW